MCLNRVSAQKIIVNFSYKLQLFINFFLTNFRSLWSRTFIYMVKYVAFTLSRALLNPAPWLRFLPAMNNAIIALGNERHDQENKMLHDLRDLLLSLR